MDNADSATDAFDHDLALSQLSAQQDVIYEVEDAINRILSGAYGICEATGKPIPAPRLKAIPWTRFARDVELRLEEDRAVSKPGLGALGSVQRGLANDAAEGESEPEAEDESLRKIFKPEAKREPSINKRRKGRML